MKLSFFKFFTLYQSAYPSFIHFTYQLELPQKGQLTFRRMSLINVFGIYRAAIMPTTSFSIYLFISHVFRSIMQQRFASNLFTLQCFPIPALTLIHKCQSITRELAQQMPWNPVLLWD